MSTNTLVSRTVDGNKNRNEVIFISTEGMSRDMLISCINLRRHYMALDPLKTSTRLDKKAERRTQALRQDIVRIQINLDRSPYSVVKGSSQVWIQPNEYIRSGAQRIIVAESVSESDEFLSCILSNRCASIGICICDEDDMQCPLLVQVFDMGIEDTEQFQ